MKTICFTFTAALIKAPKNLKLEGRHPIGLYYTPLFNRTHSHQAGKTTANRFSFNYRAHGDLLTSEKIRQSSVTSGPL